MEPEGLGIQMSSSTSGLGYGQELLSPSFSLGPSLCVVSSRIILNSLSLTRRKYAICITKCVKGGGMLVLARKEAGRGVKADF